MPRKLLSTANYLIRVISKILKRLPNIAGDPAQQVIDLLVFLGYFGACLYAGGVAYQSSYNNFFYLNIKSASGYLDLAVVFITDVLFDGEYWLISTAYIFFFIFVYYICRYIIRPYFGYLVLSFLLYFTFLICIYVGQYQGKTQAISDKYINTTSTPIIKLYGANLSGDKYDNGSYHLLSEDSQRLFVFQPPGVQGSVIMLNAISKEKIDRFEVTVK